ncbi:MAG: IS1595 family transposase [Gammaproteobacteria bacterium]|nr:IS1595 family transposase [Gammaproteobacteria bacterium]MXY90497.1 IS1595 family transposase [Gammaproteobacteria bacterium]MYG95894.1 IS1595 family transposase [Gammaproteobacteria bacterium]
MNILKMYERFPTQESCIAHLEKARWGNGKPVCPYCGSQNTAKSQHRHRCYDCKTGFSVTVGTIFHRTHLPLQKWFFAILLMMNAKKGLSALQLHRDLKVNKNTAWRITMQIRKAMTTANQRDILTGIVEMDETYIGGKPRKGTKGDGPDGQHKRGRGTKKAPVIGAVERGGKVTARAVHKEKMKGRHLRAFVRERVKTEASQLITDEYKGYLGMGKLLPHSVIKHQEWYVDGDVHTNTIEGFWAMLKRGMFGQYHSVSGRRLQRYVDEFCFRYNRRQTDTWLVFDELIGRGLGAAL